MEGFIALNATVVDIIKYRGVYVQKIIKLSTKDARSPIKTLGAMIARRNVGCFDSFHIGRFWYSPWEWWYVGLVRCVYAM